jgi:chitin disaccharide deacetylase
MTEPSLAPRGLVVTADDFGLHDAINDAVERAHKDGVLTAASLMVSGPAAAGAVERASRMPGLRVGLHVVLADGYATLPPTEIPDLVDASGRFGDQMVRDGIRFFVLPNVRRQLAAEIEAQFRAFQATGLKLDHVNAHKHFHLHPTVLSLIVSTGRRFGIRAVRLPAENSPPLLLRTWLWRMRRRLDRAGLAHNDHICGMERSGAMDEGAVLAALSSLRGGITEIYFHPATQCRITPSMASYRHTDEFAALLSPNVRAAMDRLGVPRGGFSDFLSPAQLAP